MITSRTKFFQVSLAFVLALVLMLPAFAPRAEAAITGTATTDNSTAGAGNVSYRIAFDTTVTDPTSVITITLPDGYSIDNNSYSGSTELKTVICNSACASGSDNGFITVGSNNRAVDNIIVNNGVVTITLANLYDLSAGSGVVFTLKNLVIDNPTSTGTYIWKADTDATGETITNLTGTTITADYEGGCYYGEEGCDYDYPYVVFDTDPSSSPTSGDVFDTQPVVKVYDHYGNLDVTYTGSVTISDYDGDGTLGGTTSVNAVAGIATFTDLSYTLGEGDSDGDSVELRAGAGGYAPDYVYINPDVVATEYYVDEYTPDETNSVGIISGSDIYVEVFAVDANGALDTDYSGTVSVSTDGAGVLSSNTGHSFSSGESDFNFNYAADSDHESVDFTLDDDDEEFDSVTLASDQVFDIAPTHFAISVTPSDAPNGDITSGTSFTATVSALNADDEVDTDFTDSVDLDLNSGSGSLSGDTSESAVAGVATFTLTYTAAADNESFTLGTDYSGSYDITDDTVNLTADVVATTLAIVDVSTEASHPNGDVQAGATFSVDIEAQDDDGTLDSDYASESDGALTCSTEGSDCFLDEPFSLLDGEVTVPILVFAASSDHESFTITAVDDGDENLTSSDGEDLTADVVATKLEFTDFPETAITSNDAFSVTVAAQNDAGVLDVDYESTVSLSNLGTGDLSGDTEVTADAGIAEFGDLSYDPAIDGDSFSLAADADGLTQAITDSIDVDIVASEFRVSVFPDEGDEGDALTAGVAGNLVIEAVDEDGNVDEDFDPTGHTFTLEDGNGFTLASHESSNEVAPTLPSSANIVSAFSAGVAELNITLTYAEVLQIEVNDTTSGDDGTSNQFEVIHTDADFLEIGLDEEGTLVVGVPADYYIAVYDEFGNIVGNGDDGDAEPFTGSVVVSTDATGASINQSHYTFTGQEDGYGQFQNAIIFHNTEEGARLYVTSAGLTSGESDEFDVTAGSQDLAITGVELTKSVATKDDSFENGWHWTVSVTVPDDETDLQMSFNNFSGPGELLAAGNIRFYSDQSDSDPITIAAAGAGSEWSDTMNVVGDLNEDMPGHQIEITLEAKVPSATADGSYSTSFGIQTNEPFEPVVVPATVPEEETVPPASVEISITAPHDGISTWAPSIDWSTATTCEYSFDDVTYMVVDCAANGSDIPAPLEGVGTLYVRGTDENAAVSTINAAFDLEIEPVVAPDPVVDEPSIVDPVIEGEPPV